MAVGDTIQFSIIGTSQGQSHYNVWYYKVTAETGGGITFGEFITNWQTHTKAEYLACLGDTYTLLGYIVKRILPSVGPLYEAPPTGDVEGTVVGAPAPSYQAAVIALRTGLVSRSGRGRTFLGAQVEENTETTNGNLFTGAYQTLVDALAAKMVDPISITGAGGTAELSMAVYSKLLNASNAIIDALPSDRPATMRSRKFRGLFGS